MSGAMGIKYNLLALIACVAGLIVALLLGQAYGIKIGHTLGLYAGSMTSTATLQAALDVMGNKDPSIGYSIAYPFGVIGPILCIYFMESGDDSSSRENKRHCCIVRCGPRPIDNLEVRPAHRKGEAGSFGQNGRSASL